METTPTGNLSNSNSRKPTRELKHSTLGLSGAARYLLVSDGASRGVLPAHLCCGHLSTGRGSRVTAESNPVVCWHTRPYPAHHRRRSASGFPVSSSQPVGTPPPCILSTHSGTGFTVAFSKPDHVTAQLKTCHPYNKFHAQLQDPQSPA